MGNEVRTIAALYVQTGGAYYGIEGVDPWDEARDARKYAGPHAVIGHPPCARWGKYWYGSPSSPRRLSLGDDGGCFASALQAVRIWGGVLEHPEGSHAWKHFGMSSPMRGGGWSSACDGLGWTCCVEQGAYGHRAKKATWLYAVRCELPVLRWTSTGEHLGTARSVKNGALERLSKRQRAATPPEFRDILISMARSVR